MAFANVTLARELFQNFFFSRQGAFGVPNIQSGLASAFGET